jgi:mannose-6-phosphate isomerase-like protein (cupin superfamily)
MIVIIVQHDNWHDNGHHNGHEAEEGDTVTTTDIPLDEQSSLLGGRIRQLRRSRGLTLVQLAAESELSHPFLSQLERGLARPSMGSLDRIARALGSSQLELMASDDDIADSGSTASAVVRADGGVSGPYGLSHGRLLVQGPSRFHPVEIIGSNTDAGEYFSHIEHEFVYVMAGAVAVDLEGREVELLGPGDSIYFGGSIGHRWSSADGSEYCLIVVKERVAGR